MELMENTTRLHRSAKELLAEADQLMRAKPSMDDDFPVLDTPIPSGHSNHKPHPALASFSQKQNTTALDQSHTVSPIGQDILPSAGMLRELSAKKLASTGSDNRETSATQTKHQAIDLDTVSADILQAVMANLDEQLSGRLKNRLETDLRPVVQRMVDNLASSVAEEVSQLVRRYVRKAIEQEINTRRKSN